MAVLVRAEIHGLVGRAPELRALLTEHAATTAGEPGCTGCAAYERLGGDPGEYLLDAWWRDESSLRAHYASPEYGNYVTAVGELLARPSDVQVHYVENSVRAQGDASLDPGRQG